MNSLLLDWSDLTAGKPAKKLIQAFTRAGANVVTAASDGKAQRSSGVSYKTLELTFADNQKISLAVKQSGDIFRVAVNGSVTPIKNPDNHVAAVKELVEKLDAGRAKFQAKLSRVKVALPKGMKSTVTKQADVLAASVAELDKQIAEATAKRDALKGELGVMDDAALDGADDPFSAYHRLILLWTSDLERKKAIESKDAEWIKSDLVKIIKRSGDNRDMNMKRGAEKVLSMFKDSSLDDAALDAAKADKLGYTAFNVEAGIGGSIKKTVIVKNDPLYSGEEEMRRDARDEVRLILGDRDAFVIAGGKQLKSLPKEAVADKKYGSSHITGQWLWMVDDVLKNVLDAVRPSKVEVGMDLHNNKINRIGMVRKITKDGIEVRTVKGLETWDFDDVDVVEDHDILDAAGSKKITQKLVKEVKASNKRSWHDKDWHEFQSRPEVKAINFAMHELGTHDISDADIASTALASLHIFSEKDGALDAAKPLTVAAIEHHKGTEHGIDYEYWKAVYSDGKKLIIGKKDADRLSEQYGVKIEKSTKALDDTSIDDAQIAAVCDAVKLAETYTDCATFDSADISSAKALLQIARENAETNAPIQEAEGRFEQAALNRENIKQFNAALAILDECEKKKADGITHDMSTEHSGTAAVMTNSVALDGEGAAHEEGETPDEENKEKQEGDDDEALDSADNRSKATDASDAADKAAEKADAIGKLAGKTITGKQWLQNWQDAIAAEKACDLAAKECGKAGWVGEQKKYKEMANWYKSVAESSKEQAGAALDSVKKDLSSYFQRGRKGKIYVSKADVKADPRFIPVRDKDGKETGEEVSSENLYETQEEADSASSKVKTGLKKLGMLDSIDPEMFTPSQRAVLDALAGGSEAEDADACRELMEMGLVDDCNALTDEGRKVVAALDSAGDGNEEWLDAALGVVPVKKITSKGFAKEIIKLGKQAGKAGAMFGRQSFAGQRAIDLITTTGNVSVIGSAGDEFEDYKARQNGAKSEFTEKGAASIARIVRAYIETDLGQGVNIATQSLAKMTKQDWQTVYNNLKDAYGMQATVFDSAALDRVSYEQAKHAVFAEAVKEDGTKVELVLLDGRINELTEKGAVSAGLEKPVNRKDAVKIAKESGNYKSVKEAGSAFDSVFINPMRSNEHVLDAVVQ